MHGILVKRAMRLTDFKKLISTSFGAFEFPRVSVQLGIISVDLRMRDLGWVMGRYPNPN